MSKIIPVILSGGSGTRLWPLSVETRPKQFLPLASANSMFADTLARICDTALFGPALIIGAERHSALMESELSGEAFADARIILEPSARNTAPAIALAAIATGSGDAVMLVMPSDHVITDLPAFLAAVTTALPAAQAGWLVTFGINPTGPETGFGYIQMANPLDGMPDVRKVARFIEKPARDKAEAMLAQGNYAWNAGIFLMRADRYLEELAAHAPEMHRTAHGALDGIDPAARCIRPLPDQFAACPSDSIDYAVMERAERVAIVPVSCGWSDVGSWDALAEIGTPDTDGNTTSGEVVVLDSHNNHIHADGITVTVSGIDDLIIIANGHHVMVVPKGRSQDVKQIAAALKDRP
ncbi:mannose-1-phosphate guanylyltransferase/mannose-6-phosphate isomerase [Blastomonas sp. AAP53]|uniref:mannose-1-phosphate guanylyltransferase/mannose-6-phosphate isomerase n=1 Tax=Blastomonas sp. AAP53 TaxID=1248760 RepID=UPI0002DC1197|nr:mannose-1-phosphate guanylyltransferase/mannose-6-phosphate isomerase [Blastomonas sp. AAP53]